MQMQITSRHGPAGKTTNPRTTTLAPLTPPSTSRSSYAAEIADSTALFDPKQVANSIRNTETKCKLYEEDQTSDRSSIRIELTSCDATSKLGKSERGAVSGGVFAGWFVMFFLLSRHAVRLSARAGSEMLPSIRAKLIHRHAVAASKTTVMLGMSC
jgi:hypothetical protein